MTTTQQLQPTVQQHLDGHWYWADLQTGDLDGSTAFYTQLFGWETQDLPTGEGTYRIATKGGMPMAAFTPQLPAGATPRWFDYVTTSDVDAAARRAGELGGTVFNEPFDVMDAGRMAIVQDPTGALFALWQAKDHPGTSNMTAHGALTWFELHTTDIDAALAFYTGLFDYEVESNDMGGGVVYHLLSSGGQQACGMMQQMGDAPDEPSAWSTYFAVDDTDAAAARVQELGGTLVYPPHDIPGVGRSAVLRDPQGGAFKIISPASS